MRRAPPFTAGQRDGALRQTALAHWTPPNDDLVPQYGGLLAADALPGARGVERISRGVGARRE
jgi:hypothetical protein